MFRFVCHIRTEISADDTKNKTKIFSFSNRTNERFLSSYQCHVGLYFLSNSFLIYAAISFSMLYFSNACVAISTGKWKSRRKNSMWNLSKCLKLTGILLHIFGHIGIFNNGFSISHFFFSNFVFCNDDFVNLFKWNELTRMYQNERRCAMISQWIDRFYLYERIKEKKEKRKNNLFNNNDVSFVDLSDREICC